MSPWDERAMTGHELPPGLERALRTALSLETPPRQLAIHNRPNTMLRVLETERGRVWIKSYRGGGDHALREYQFLRRAQHALRGAASLAVPEPIARLGPTTIALGDVSGRPMRRLLTDGSNADCEAAVRRCGEWLAAVHRAGAENTKTFDLRLAASFVAARWDGLTDRASRLASAASAWDRAGVLTHGDFAPHNVIVDRERVVVLDPSFHQEFGRRDGCCSRQEDVARFWVSLRGLTLDEHGSEKRRALANAFLEAYSGGRDIRTPGFMLFAVLQMGNALRDWSGLAQEAQSIRLREWLAEFDGAR